MVVIKEIVVNKVTEKFSKSYSSIGQTTSQNTNSSRIDEEEDDNVNKNCNKSNEYTEGSDEQMNVDSREDENDSDHDVGDDNDQEMSDDDDDSQLSSEEEASEGTEEVKSSGMDIVRDVLAKAAKEAEKNESIAVSKHLDLEYDLGTLLAIDTNELDFDSLSNSTEEYLKNLARDNTQLLINHIWELPITRKETEIVAKLPLPIYKLPREKPIPKPKQMTKWEKFAVDKGIQKTKKGKKWDDVLQKWIPKWGYKKVQAKREREWLIENKQTEDPMQDPFAKQKAERNERVAKNELQRMRNIARGRNMKLPRGDEMQGDNQQKIGKGGSKKGKKKSMPRMGLLTSDKMNSYELKQAVTISRASTASLGKFQSKLPNEKDGRNVSKLMPMAKKRRAAMLKPEEERNAYIETIDNILKKKPKLDLDKAVNRHINQEERQRAEEKTQGPKNKSRGKARGARKGNPKGKGQGKVRMGNKGNKGGKKNSRGGKKN